MNLKAKIHTVKPEVHEMMTAEEAANYLKVARHTLYQWISEERRGKCTLGFRYYKYGKGIRFNRPDLDKWLNTRIVEPNSSF